MQAAILIGGAGTRLGAYVRHRPKPLLEVAGRPFLDHLLANLVRFGVDEIVLLAGYRAAVVRQEYDDPTRLRERLGAAFAPGRIEVVVEPRPLGTAGALCHAAARLAPDFFLLNGDSFFDFNYLDLHADAGDADAVMALRRVDDASRYGLVETADGVVTAFREKPATPSAGAVNGGVYRLRRDLVAEMGATTCSLEAEVFPRLVADGRLHARIYDGLFIDIGIPTDLERADRTLAGALRRPAVFLALPAWTLGDDASECIRLARLVKGWNDAGRFVFGVVGGVDVKEGAERRQVLAGRLRAHGAHLDDLALLADAADPPAAAAMATPVAAWLGHWPIRRERSRILTVAGVGSTAAGLPVEAPPAW